MPTTPVIARSLTDYARTWLQTAQHVRVLHCFEQVHNLIDEQQRVISLVTPAIGNGPFAVVVPRLCHYTDIDFSHATLWNTQPDWHQARSIHAHIPRLSACLDAYTHPATSSFQRLALNQMELGTARVLEAIHQPQRLQLAVQALAGQGMGLTPAGDDWLLGCMIALHVQGYPAVAAYISNNATPLTTPLSATWLSMAGQGNIDERWHRLFKAQALVEVEAACWAILQQGHSSGVDAMRGFIQTLAVQQKPRFAASAHYPNPLSEGQ